MVCSNISVVFGPLLLLFCGGRCQTLIFWKSVKSDLISFLSATWVWWWSLKPDGCFAGWRKSRLGESNEIVKRNESKTVLTWRVSWLFVKNNSIHKSASGLNKSFLYNKVFSSQIQKLNYYIERRIGVYLNV